MIRIRYAELLVLLTFAALMVVGYTIADTYKHDVCLRCLIKGGFGP